METRPGCRVLAIYFTELHVDNNNMTRMPCLIMQYKPYIVELPPTKEAYNTDCKKICSYCSTRTQCMYSLVEQSCMGASRSCVCVKGQ